MTILGIDFGASNTDLVLLQSKKIIKSKRFPVTHFRKPNFTQLFHSFSLSKISHIFVTGWGARYFPSQWKNIPVTKVPEIQAIARGAQLTARTRIHIFAPHLKFIFPKNAGLAIALGAIQG